MPASLNAYKNIIKAYSGTVYFPYERPFTIPKSDDFTWYAKMSQQFDLPKDFHLQISGIYYAPKNIAQGRENATLEHGHRSKKNMVERKVGNLYLRE